jgi:hypothetical protein
MKGEKRVAETPVSGKGFRPQKKWLVVVSLVFAGWVAFLVYLYVTTVLPHRSPGALTNLPYRSQ